MATTLAKHTSNRALSERLLVRPVSWRSLLSMVLVVIGLSGRPARADDSEPPINVASLTGFEWVGDAAIITARDSAPHVGVGGGIDVDPQVEVPQVPAEEGAATVLLPPRPAATLGEWSIRLPVPLIRQIGDKSNCGPSAAAMAVGSYAGEASPANLRDLRNAIGEWTWQRFPRRQRKAEGSDAGGTTRTMMMQSLNRFGQQHWTDTRHSWVPEDLWAIVRLRRALAERRPLVVLAEAAPLWGIGTAGLHWVVVTGFEDGQVLMHDPADGREAAVPLPTFWQAWRLPERFHAGPGRNGFEGLVADQSLPVSLTIVPKARHLAHEALEQNRF